MARIFISYSRSDKNFVEQFLPLARRLFPEHEFFYDDHITGGEDWWQRILSEIDNADLFIYLLSNESLESDYCQAEFREAQRLNKQILPVIVRRLQLHRAPDDMEAEIRRLNWVDMTPGFKDADAYTRLQAAIRQRLLNMPTSTPPPTRSTPTPEPEVRDKTDSQIKAAYIGGGFLLISVVIAGIFGLWQGVFANPSPTPVAQVEVTDDVISNTPTANRSPTPTPTRTPTLSATDIEVTIRAEMQAIAVEEQLTADAANTATEDAARRAAQGTATALTATADSWTPTPTINTRQTAEARRTATAYAVETQQAATVTQQWIDSWTDTPTATSTPTSTPTATDTPTPLQLALQRASAGVTSNAQWEEWYPDGFEREFDGVPMVLVPTGCFPMGSDSDAADSDEQPEHERCIEEPFWIDRYEVSQSQFQRLGGEADRSSNFTGDDLPRESIDWFEARDFCEQRGARLPTEKEWEYAGAGPDNLVYPWGNEWDGSLVNSNNNIGSDDYENTAPVDMFPEGTSWVGAEQMSGNVWEWTSSLYEPYPYDADDGREADTGDRSDVRRVLRGGSWVSNGSVFFRVSNRDRDYPKLGGNNLGLRCVRSSK